MLSEHEGRIRECAGTILSVCAGIKKGESVLLVTDSPGSDTRPSILAAQAGAMGAKVAIMALGVDVTREPPEEISRTMLQNDVTVFCVNEARTLLWGHADAKVAAIRKGGRVLFLTQPIESTPSADELRAIRDRSLRLADVLEKASKVTLLTDGYRLDLKLGGRRALRLSSILSDAGSWGAVPDYAEAGVAPLENETNGDLRVDGIIVGLGRVVEPVDLHFESGRLVTISGGETGKAFERMLGSESSARVLCELGFGTNHLRKEIRGEFDDKKALGTVHIAMGDNHTFGGTNRSTLHIDCLVTKPEVMIDDRPFVLSSV